MGSNTNKAFTILELSIVLVVIGILTGSVLIGQELLFISRARATGTQIERISTAVNTFREQYNALPGDYNLAIQNINSSTQNGDGNNYVWQQPGLPTGAPIFVYDGASGTNELSLFFSHLHLSKVLPLGYDGSKSVIKLDYNFPLMRTKNGGIIAYSLSDSNLYYHLGLKDTSGGGSSPLSTVNVLTPTEAKSIDQKYDDGKPFTGAIVARGGSVLEVMATFNSSVSSGACVTSTAASSALALADANAAYKISNNAVECQLRIQYK